MYVLSVSGMRNVCVEYVQCVFAPHRKQVPRAVAVLAVTERQHSTGLPTRLNGCSQLDTPCTVDRQEPTVHVLQGDRRAVRQRLR